jgi:uncharacterized protein (TIGR03437 family)
VARFFSSFFLLAAMAAAANAQCYEFTGPGVMLDINIATITLQLGPSFLAGGYTTTYTYSGDNSLIVGGTKLTSKSTLDGLGNIQYLPGSGADSGATTFELVVPSDKTAGAGKHSWVAMIASNQNLIPSGLLPAVLPPISEWTLTGSINVVGSNYDYIEVEEGAARTKYPITGLGTCSSGTNPGGSQPIITGVVSASAFGGFASVTPGGWIEIYGSNLSPDVRGWAGTDFQGNDAPTKLDGVSVSIDGQPAFVDFVSPNQVDVLLPSNIPTGPLQLTLTNGAATSGPFTVNVNSTEPGLLAPGSFKVGANQCVVAQFIDGTYALPAGAIAGVASRPAKPGETIIIYGVGFGAVTPAIPAGQIVGAANQLVASLQVSFGQTPAQVTYFGLAPNLVGVYQFNVVVPPVPDSDVVPLSFNLGGVPGTQKLVIAVHQ